MPQYDLPCNSCAACPVYDHRSKRRSRGVGAYLLILFGNGLQGIVNAYSRGVFMTVAGSVQSEIGAQINPADIGIGHNLSGSTGFQYTPIM